MVKFTKHAPVTLQVLGVTAMVVGLFLLLGLVWGLVTGGALVLVGGAVAEATVLAKRPARAGGDR